MDIQIGHYMQHEKTLKFLLNKEALKRRGKVALINMSKTSNGSTHLDVVFKFASPEGSYTTLESAVFHYDGSCTEEKCTLLPEVLLTWLPIVRARYLVMKTDEIMGKIKEELIATAMHPQRIGQFD